MTEEIEDFKSKQELSEQRMRDLELEMQELTEQYELNKKDLYEQLDQKDQGLSESYQQLMDARKEVTNQQDAVDQAENAIREYRAKMRDMEEDMLADKQRYEQNELDT